MKRWLSLLVCLTIILISGCWDKREIEQLAFIMAIGIDQADANNYLVSFQITLPPGQQEDKAQSKQAKTITLSFKSNSIRSAADQIYKTLDRSPFVGQVRLVVFSDEVARNGLTPHLDHLSRFYRLRRNVDLMVVKGSAAELFKTTPSGSGISALNLAQRVDAANEEGITEMITVGNFITKLESAKIEPVIPGVKILSPDDSKVKFPKKQEELSLEQLAVFKDGRMVGWLNDKETRGYMYVTGKSQRHHVTIIYGPKQSVYLDISRPIIRKKIDIEDGLPVITLDFKAQADMVEVAIDKNLPHDKWPEIYAGFSLKADEIIRDEILSSVSAAQQKYHSDIFGFGQLIYRDKPELWRQIAPRWDEEIFPQLKVKVNTDIKIKRGGATSTPPYPQNNQRELPLVE